MSSIPNLGSFILTEKLGRGSYATVYKAFRKGSNREVVAIKCVEKGSLTKSAVDNLITEISILKKVKHEYIVELKDFEWDDKYIYLIMEYCSGGDLSHFIRLKRRLPEAIVRRFLQQLATALQVLRNHNITHMDLKPQNILLSNNNHPILKLADFGFAQYMQLEDSATSLRGSPLYMAPEILLKNHYDARVDLWSVGIILYECLFGQAPFSSESFAQLAEKIKSTKPIQIPYGANISESCRDLLLCLLQRDPEKRISFEDFFNHNFIDLEHMPSAQSYQKAVDLLREAVEKDQKGEVNDAIHQYCEGLQYLVPFTTSEPTQARRMALRQKVEEYMKRAEELKNIVKSNCDDIREAPSIELSQIISENPILEKAIQKVKEAENLAHYEKYDEAASIYQEALGAMIRIVTALPTGEKKTLLFKEVNSWMRKAEDLKSYLKAQHLQTKEILAAMKTDVNTANSITSNQNCCIQ